MNREIDHFINSEGSLISSSDKMVIENNPEVITQAIKNGYFKKLLEEMCYQIGEQKNANYKVDEIQYSYNAVKKIYEGLTGLIKTLDESGKNRIK